MAIIFNTIVLILRKSGSMLWELLPYVLIGTVTGEIIKYTSWTKLIYKAISNSPLASILIAVILGMISPLCTYGTIPVILNLFQAGIHIAPLAAFLSASSLMNPQLFILTWGGLGVEMALVRVSAVFIFGVSIGLILYKIPVSWIINTHIQATLAKQEEILNSVPKPFRFNALFKNIWKSLQFVGFYLVIGIILGAMVEVLVPAQWISLIFKPGKWLSVLIAVIIGVPLYACGGGVIPFIRSCLDQGMSKGAALAFLLTGPATRITPLMALAAVLKPWFLIVYILFIMLFSLCAGVIYG